MHYIRSCVAVNSNAKKFLGRKQTNKQTNATCFVAFKFSFLSRREVLDSSSCNNGNSHKPEVERPWDNSFSWKLFLTILCCHEIYTLTQLRGFICGIANWINPNSILVAACTKLDPPINSQNLTSCARLDYPFLFE